MKLRIWTTPVDPTRANEYEEFARKISLPMFRAQPGFRGVAMGRSGGAAVVITFWEDERAVAALDSSQSYRRTVQEISEAGFLGSQQRVEVLDLHLAEFTH